MTHYYRTPEQTAADYQHHAERYERLGQPRNAEVYRIHAAEQPALAARIAAVLSVETEGQR